MENANEFVVPVTVNVRLRVRLAPEAAPADAKAAPPANGKPAAAPSANGRADAPKAGPKPADAGGKAAPAPAGRGAGALPPDVAAAVAAAEGSTREVGARFGVAASTVGRVRRAAAAGVGVTRRRTSTRTETVTVSAGVPPAGNLGRRLPESVRRRLRESVGPVALTARAFGVDHKTVRRYRGEAAALAAEVNGRH